MPETSTITYRVSSSVKAHSLTFIVPLSFKGGKARIFTDNDPKEYVEANLLGGEYAMFTTDIDSEELIITIDYG